MIKELTTEIERLKLDLVATREKNGIYISVERCVSLTFHNCGCMLLGGRATPTLLDTHMAFCIMIVIIFADFAPQRCCCCCQNRYEAYELERAQLREGTTRHKTELEALVTEHEAELTSIKAAHGAQMSAAAERAAELEAALQQAGADLAAARVRAPHDMCCCYAWLAGWLAHLAAALFTLHTHTHTHIYTHTHTHIRTNTQTNTHTHTKKKKKK